MAQSNVGDVISDCPGCDTKDSVIYRGNSEGVCNKCGSIYEVSFDEELPPAEQKSESLPSTPPPIAIPELPKQQVVQQNDLLPAQPPKPVEPIARPQQALTQKSKITAADIGQLAAVIPVLIDTPMKAIKLDEKINTAVVAATDLGLPGYILKSRPWRWAHEMNKTGNPYREDSKSWQIFNVLAIANGLTAAQVVQALDRTMGDKICFLLTVYEVLTQCAAVGLLVMDPQSRRFTICQNQPKPTAFP